MRQRQTLVLNTDFKPLSTWPPSIVSVEEAVHMMIRERAYAVEDWPGEFLRTPSMQFPVPKVVALRHYAPVFAQPKFCRRSVILRDRFCCQYCGEQFPPHELSFDHVIPREKGGVTDWDNILMACVPCNAAKKNTLPNYSGRKGERDAAGRMRPLKVPRRPTTAELLRAGLEFLPKDISESFGDWLYWDSELQA